MIKNYKWLEKPEERIYSETIHRLALLNLAKQFNPEWIFCADADERFIGDIKKILYSEKAKNIDMIRIQLFDAYITQEDQVSYKQGQKLMNFRKYFGPERRDIIMLWKAKYKDITFCGLDAREPVHSKERKVTTKFYCQHYGKSISIQHWEETCDYYSKHFPYETYGKKWMQRKGKAIHMKSDFQAHLYEWGEELFKNSIVIHPNFAK